MLSSCQFSVTKKQIDNSVLIVENLIRQKKQYKQYLHIALFTCENIKPNATYQILQFGARLPSPHYKHNNITIIFVCFKEKNL